MNASQKWKELLDKAQKPSLSKEEIVELHNAATNLTLEFPEYYDWAEFEDLTYNYIREEYKYHIHIENLIHFCNTGKFPDEVQS